MINSFTSSSSVEELDQWFETHINDTCCVYLDKYDDNLKTIVSIKSHWNELTKDKKLKYTKAINECNPFLRDYLLAAKSIISKNDSVNTFRTRILAGVYLALISKIILNKESSNP